MNDLVVWIDSASEVISVRRNGAQISTSRGAEGDDYLFLDLDDRKQVIGVRLTAANEMPPAYWMEHPDRNEIPPDILSKMDELIPFVYGRGSAQKHG